MSDSDLINLTVEELKEKLRERGLSRSGRKADLVSRLLEATQPGDEEKTNEELLEATQCGNEKKTNEKLLEATQPGNKKKTNEKLLEATQRGTEEKTNMDEMKNAADSMPGPSGESGHENSKNKADVKKNATGDDQDGEELRGSLLVTCDEGEAAEYQGDCLGLYHKVSYGIYLQAGGSFYIYQVPNRTWYISTEWKNECGYVKNQSETNGSGGGLPPIHNWQYYDGANYNHDPHLLVNLTTPDLSLQMACGVITITSSRCPHKRYLGEFYRVEGQYSCGRPLFRNEHKKFLQVPENSTSWSVSDEKNNTTAFIQCGRATSCPANLMAGVTQRYKEKCWKYGDGEGWIEDGSIQVRCNRHHHESKGIKQIQEKVEDSFEHREILEEEKSLAHASQPIINTYGKITMTVRNLALMTVLGIKPEDECTFLTLLAPEGDEADINQKLTRLQNLRSVCGHCRNSVAYQLPEVATITRSTALLHYSGSNGGPWHGTAFIATLDDSANFSGVVLFSAGHNFENGGVFLSDYSNFSFCFNNISGHKDESSAIAAGDKDCIFLNLQEDLLNKYDCSLVITYKGLQFIRRSDSSLRQEKLSGEADRLDYFALVIRNQDIQIQFRNLGLRFLPCASSSQLGPARGHPVLIFGYPGVDDCKCPPGTCSCTHARYPLRLSYGEETGASQHKMKYNLDTLVGNSGSPVTGKFYTVKGIHTGAGINTESNKAQTMETLLENLRKLSILPTTTP